MDWGHLHLALNHIPVIAIPLMAALFGWGWIRRSPAIRQVALVWMAGLCVAAILIKFTGDEAATAGAPRLAPVRMWVERHEEAADQASTLAFILGLASALAVFRGRALEVLPTWLAVLVLILAFATTVLFIRCAGSGGWIGHPELRPAIELKKV